MAGKKEAGKKRGPARCPDTPRPILDPKPNLTQEPQDGSRRMWGLLPHHLYHHLWGSATHSPHCKPLKFNIFVPKGELRSRPETWSVQSKVRARAQVF